MLQEIKAIVRLYEQRGFKVVAINCDQEFKCIQEEMHPIRLQVVDKDNHVPEVERSIRVVKKRIRCTIAGMPFRRIPRVMIRGLASFAVRSLNQLPALNGITTLMSPLAIVTGKGNINFNKLTLKFGEYAQIFDDHSPTNNTDARTIGGIAMSHLGSTDGGYDFVSLSTGECIQRKQWTKVPMPEWVVEYIENMAEAKKQKLFVEGEPLWEWRPGVMINDVENEGDDDNNLFADLANAEIEADVQLQLRNQNQNDKEPAIEPYFGELYNIDEADDDPPEWPCCNAVVSDVDDTSADEDANLSSGSESDGVFDDSDISFDHSNLFGTESDTAMPIPSNTPIDAPTDPIATDTIVDDLEIAPAQRSKGKIQDNSIEPEPIPNPSNLRRSSRPHVKSNYKVRFSDDMSAARNAKTYRRDHQLLQQGLSDFKSNPNNTTKIQRFVTGFIMTQKQA
jgi:hypothetical protein